MGSKGEATPPPHPLSRTCLLPLPAILDEMIDHFLGPITSTRRRSSSSSCVVGWRAMSGSFFAWRRERVRGMLTPQCPIIPPRRPLQRLFCSHLWRPCRHNWHLGSPGSCVGSKVFFLARVRAAHTRAASAAPLCSLLRQALAAGKGSSSPNQAVMKAA